jgi:hypothetical protein
MEFIRKKCRGLDRRTAKMWISKCGHYRITWRAEVWGVKITPQYQCCVRTYRLPLGTDDKMWNFAGRRGPYRKFNAAVEAAEKHERLWRYAIQVSETERKGRNERLRVIEARARVGSGITLNRVMCSLPVWVRPLANQILLKRLFPAFFGEPEQVDDECNLPETLPEASGSPSQEDAFDQSQSDPTDLSLSSEQKPTRGTRKSSSRPRKTPTSGPASNAKVEEESMTPKKKRTRLKATSSEPGSPAPIAEEAVAVAEKPSRKSTTKSSKSTSKKSGGKRRSTKPATAA